MKLGRVGEASLFCLPVDGDADAALLLRTIADAYVALPRFVA